MKHQVTPKRWYPHPSLLGVIVQKPEIIIMLAITYTYLLTPWSRVLREKLTGLQLVKKFPTFYGTRMFITAFTSARHVSVS